MLSSSSSLSFSSISASRFVTFLAVNIMNSPAGLDVKRFFSIAREQVEVVVCFEFEVSLPEILVRKLPFPGVDHYEGGGGEGN